jgi:hypothetical protein
MGLQGPDPEETVNIDLQYDGQIIAVCMCMSIFLTSAVTKQEVRSHILYLEDASISFLVLQASAFSRISRHSKAHKL